MDHEEFVAHLLLIGFTRPKTAAPWIYQAEVSGFAVRVIAPRKAEAKMTIKVRPRYELAFEYDSDHSLYSSALKRIAELTEAIKE